ncbi:MAG: hypothetical protein GF308_10700 [Candidatus Heimdallarchaeota archaeon]|nr:hypothetical protein [Candidatus Heimdallarchaeota archaeon]
MNIGKPKEVKAVMNETQPLMPDITIGPEDQVYVTYIEMRQNHTKLCLLQSDNYFYTKSNISYLYESTDKELITSYPSILSTQEALYIAFTISEEETTSLKILKKNHDETNWQTYYTINNESAIFYQPVLKQDKNNLLWLSWKSNFTVDNTANEDFFYCYQNKTSDQWTSPIQLTENKTAHKQKLNLAFDKNNTCHIAWSEGNLDHHRIFYQKIFDNGTKTSPEILTDCTNNYLSPNIVIDLNDTVHLFWSKYLPYWMDKVGARKVEWVYTNHTGTWSEPVEVAPWKEEYIISKNCEAYDPEAIVDYQNQLWLTFTVRGDPIYFHFGVDLRGRINGVWQKSDALHTGSIATFDSMLDDDSEGNIHCVWVDVRYVAFELFYRVKYATGLLSDETRITFYLKESSSGWGRSILISIAIGSAIALIPLLIYAWIKKRRKQKKKRY